MDRTLDLVMMALPEKGRRAVSRLVDSLVTAKAPGRDRALRGAAG